MDKHMTSQYLLSRLAIILKHKHRIKSVTLRPEVTTIFSKEYFRMYVDIRLAYPSLHKSQAETSAEEKADLDAFFDVGTSRNVNGVAFTSSLLAQESYWKDLYGCIEVFEALAHFFKAMISDILGEQIPVDIIPASSVPECSLAIRYFYKLEAPKQSFNSLVSKDWEKELFWKYELESKRIDGWPAKGKHEIIEEEELEKLMPTTNSLISMMVNKPIHFVEVKGYNPHMDTRKFDLNQILGTIKDDPNYSKECKRIEQFILGRENAKSKRSEEERKAIEVIPYKVGDVIVVPKSSFFGSARDKTPIAVWIESVNASFSTVEINHCLISSNLKKGARKGSTDARLVMWHSTWEEFEQLIKKQGIKRNEDFLSWLEQQKDEEG